MTECVLNYTIQKNPANQSLQSDRLILCLSCRRYNNGKRENAITHYICLDDATTIIFNLERYLKKVLSF